jgi:hypothetical protein
MADHYPIKSNVAEIPGVTFETVCTTCGKTRGLHNTRTENAPAGRGYIQCPTGSYFTYQETKMTIASLLDQHKDKLQPLVDRGDIIEAIKEGRRLCSEAGIDSSLYGVKEYIQTFRKTRQYGINQKMIAKFPGKCLLCSGSIVAGTDIIVPVLSERTPRGRHPWVHEVCMNGDLSGVKVEAANTVSTLAGQQEEEEPQAPPSRFLVDPPRVSQRQKDVVAKNLEAILLALAKNPGQVYALVPATETTTDAVLVTEAIKPQADAASA